MIRRLDHVAILVRSTDEAICHFSDRLGLPVVASEEIEAPAARLTYLDAGNAYLQLVEPLADGPLSEQLDQAGEGLHHICFGADEPVLDATALGDGVKATPGTGRGRVSAFVPGPLRNGVRVECTRFDREADVARTPGALGL